MISPPLEKVNLQFTGKNIKQVDLTYQDMPLQFSMSIPHNTRLGYLSLMPKTGNTFYLVHSAPNNQFRLSGDISDWLLWRSFYQSSGKFQGFKNENEFFQKMYSERFALKYLLELKFYLSEKPVRIWESQVNGLNIFVSETPGTQRVKNYHVSVFFEGKYIGEFKLRNIDQNLFKSILSTLRPQIRKTAKEYYGNGIHHMKLKDFEAAKFSFASAVYVEPENPDYQFAYGKLNLDIGYYYVAVKAFEKVIELQPDFPEAQQLLKTAREEREKQKKEREREKEKKKDS